MYQRCLIFYFPMPKIIEVLAKLEANLYSGTHHLIDQKELKCMGKEKGIG